MKRIKKSFISCYFTFANPPNPRFSWLFWLAAEMIVGPTKALFMDEISNGLDSSTTFQVVTCLQQLVHITDTTALVSLLQPAPETFNLFDEVILMAEGKIVYHGPRSHVLQFFEDCGFKCPERKGAADFLQEVRSHYFFSTIVSCPDCLISSHFNHLQVISRNDQAQYWYHADLPYNYVSVDEFSKMFKASYFGQKLNDELSEPYDKTKGHSNALSFDTYSLSKYELFKACMARELLLMKRNSFVYVFKTVQVKIYSLEYLGWWFYSCTANHLKLTHFRIPLSCS